MKQFATIIFVLLFALAGNSQLQDFSQKNNSCHDISFTNGNPSSQNPFFFEDFCYDGQDTNDIDGFDVVSVLSDSYHIFQHSELRSFFTAGPSQQLMQFSELLLDLPPPMLSL